MKILLISFCLSTGFVSLAQSTNIDLAQVDSRILNSKISAPPILAKELTRYCTNDREKVSTIFRWIAENIDYKVKTRSFLPSGKNELIPDDDTPLKSLEERVSETVLETKTATCFGYARLFKTLCDYAGIRSEIITGYARSDTKTGSRFRSNHNWNAVWIDSSWKLMDITWASGFISYRGDRFIRDFDEKYFMTPPQEFIKDHYPDDVYWTLMDDPPAIAEFRLSPYKQKTFSKYTITSYQPSRGIIEVSLGDTVQLQLELADAKKDKRIGSDPFLDKNKYSTANAVLLSPSLEQPSRITYSYCANTPGIKWVYLLYNNDVVLRYRLSIKKQEIPVAYQRPD